MYVAGELYREGVPGLYGTGWARNRCTHVPGGKVESAMKPTGASEICPVLMRRRSRTRSARRLADGADGASAGKNDSTGASTESLPSATASPTAVGGKLLLSEYSMCGVRASYGVHHPSATPLPCR